MQSGVTSKVMPETSRLFHTHRRVQVIRKSAARPLAAGVGAIVLLALCVGAVRAAEYELIQQIAGASVDGTGRFVAADAFKLGNNIGGRKLGAIGWSFAEHFLNIAEEDVPPALLKVWAIQLTVGDVALVRRLGGEERAAVASVAHVYRLMQMGGGLSHTDGRSNIAYVRSPLDRRLWALHWSVNFTNEWTIGAVHVPHRYLDWHADTRLFSR